MANIANFWYNFAKNGYTPLTDFYKIWQGGGSPRFAPSRQILPFWLSKCGLTAQKIAKNGNFWYKFAPKGYIPLSNFYKVLPGEGMPNFTVVTLKIWPYGSRKRLKMVIFGKINICPSGKILGVDRKT